MTCACPKTNIPPSVEAGRAARRTWAHHRRTTGPDLSASTSARISHMHATCERPVWSHFSPPAGRPSPYPPPLFFFRLPAVPVSFFETGPDMLPTFPGAFLSVCSVGSIWQCSRRASPQIAISYRKKGKNPLPPSPSPLSCREEDVCPRDDALSRPFGNSLGSGARRASTRTRICKYDTATIRVFPFGGQLKATSHRALLLWEAHCLFWRAASSQYGKAV